MIILDSKYAIIAGEKTFNLATKQVVKGKESYFSQTYHSSIQSALEYYIKIKQLEKLNSKTYKSIKEAIEDLKQLQEDIKSRINL